MALNRHWGRPNRIAGIIAILAGLGPVVSATPANSGKGVSVAAPPALSTGLDAQTRSAQSMAETLSRRLKGTKVVAVLANGNLEPVFEENAFLVVEPANRAALRVGDMVTYEHPNLHKTVVQRLLKPSDVSAGPETPVMRVVAVIYARKNAGMPGLVAAGAKNLAAPTSGATAVAAAAR